MWIISFFVSLWFNIDPTCDQLFGNGFLSQRVLCDNVRPFDWWNKTVLKATEVIEPTTRRITSVTDDGSIVCHTNAVLSFILIVQRYWNIMSLRSVPPIAKCAMWLSTPNKCTSRFANCSSYVHFNNFIFWFQRGGEDPASVKGRSEDDEFVRYFSDSPVLIEIQIWPCLLILAKICSF